MPANKQKLQSQDIVREVEFGVVKTIDEENRIIEGIGSTEAVDSYKDIIKQDGWDLSEFMKNPVMPWGHETHDVPVAKIIKIWIEDKKLMFRAQFAGLDQAHPKAEKIFRMYRDGFLKAFSVGFRALEWDQNEHGGFTFTKSLLKEISAVSIGANPEALTKMAKELKMDREDLRKTLDEGKMEMKIFEETENEYRYRVRPPEDFEQDSFRTITLQETPDVRAVIGKLVGETTTKIQSIRFPKTDWTEDEAKKWIDDHKDQLGKSMFVVDNPDKSDANEMIAKILTEKHEELKAYRKMAKRLSKELGVERSDKELDTIAELEAKLLIRLGMEKTLDEMKNKAPNGEPGGEKNKSDEETVNPLLLRSILG